MLSAEANVPSLDVTPCSERPFHVSDETNVRDLDATGNFERYLTGEERFPLYHLRVSSSDLHQTLLSNVRKPTSTTRFLLPSNSSFLDLGTTRARS